MCETEINYYENVLNVREAAYKFEELNCDEGLNLCDLSSVERMFRLWQKKLPRVKPFYAVKCNSDPQIVRTLAELGTGFDCASKNELKQILDLGVTPKRIIYANPCRSVSHMNYARENKVLKLTVDNEFEIYKMHKHYPKAELVVRYKCEAKKARYPLGGKFGCDPQAEAPALMLLAKALNMSVTGTSFHVGSSCMDTDVYGQAIELGSQIFDFGKLLGFDMQLLDIGGGFSGCNDAQFEKTAETIDTALQTYFQDDRVEIISEPGQFFVSAACTVVCKISAKREIRNAAGRVDTIMYYLNDGVFGSFIAVVFDEPLTIRHFLDTKGKHLPTFKSLLWGPTCDALDKICAEVQLPNLNRGDLIGFYNMGAYTSVLASTFNGFHSSKTIYYKAKAKTI